MLKTTDPNRIAVPTLNSFAGAGSGQIPKEGYLFGLELELEGRNVGLEGVASKNWKRVEDGSLRGESIEYIFNTPCDYTEAVSRVNKLFGMFTKHKVNLKDSYRTSTHVHLNFSDKTVKQAVSFFFIHTILEELLEYYCGDLRKGNLFCLSCRDNENLVELLEQSIFSVGNLIMFNNEVRYNAANLASLNKFGTIEIRTMRGASTAEQVNDWLSILNQMYEFACKDAPPPWRLCESLSFLGADGFLAQMFDEATIRKLMTTWPAARHLAQSLMDGVRLIQMLAYKLEDAWNTPFEKPEIPVKKAPRKARANLDALVNGPLDDAYQVRLDDGQIVNVPSVFGLPNGYLVNIGVEISIIYNSEENSYFYYDSWSNGPDFNCPVRWHRYAELVLMRHSRNEIKMNKVWYEVYDPDALEDLELDDEDEE